MARGKISSDFPKGSGHPEQRKWMAQLIGNVKGGRDHSAPSKGDKRRLIMDKKSISYANRAVATHRARVAKAQTRGVAPRQAGSVRSGSMADDAYHRDSVGKFSK